MIYDCNKRRCWGQWDNGRRFGGRPHCSVMVVKLVLSQSQRTELMFASQCDASGRSPVFEHHNKPTRNAYRRTGPKNEVTMKKSRIRVVEVHRGDSTVRLDPTATPQPFANKRWKETRQNGVAETRTVSISDQFWVHSRAKHCPNVQRQVGLHTVWIR